MPNNFGRTAGASARLNRYGSFTLLEMLLAIAIFALVMAAVGFTMRGIIDSWRKIDSHGIYIREYRQLEQLANSAFRNAVVFYWKKPNTNTEMLAFDGLPDELWLCYTHRIGVAGEGGLRFLHLFRDEEGNLVAEYRPQPLLSDYDDDFASFGRDAEVEDKVEREVLQRGISELNFIYGDISSETLKWDDTWRGKSKRRLPMAIQMELVWEDGRREVWLRRIAGNTEYQRMVNEEE